MRLQRDCLLLCAKGNMTKMKPIITGLLLFLIFIVSCENQSTSAIDPAIHETEIVWDSLTVISITDTLFVSIDSSVTFDDSISISIDANKLDSVHLRIGHLNNNATCNFSSGKRNDTVFISPRCAANDTLKILSFNHSPCVAILVIQNGQIIASIPRQWQGTSVHVRPIEMVFSNLADTAICEAAPGDSMRLSCYFFGNSIESVQFSATNKIKTGIYGNDSVWDIAPLEYIVEEPLSETNQYTRHIAIKFKIPEDIIITSPTIDEGKLSQSGHSKEELFSTLNHLSELSPENWQSDSLVNELNQSGTGLILMQLLSVPLRFIVSFGDGQKVVSTLFVRPNRLFSLTSKKLNGIFSNRNPVAKSLSFSSFGNSILLGSNAVDSIRINSGQDCELKLEIDSVQIDSFFIDVSGTAHPEEYFIEYLYSFDSNESHCVPMNVTGCLSENGFSATFTPPFCERIQSVHFWVIICNLGQAAINQSTGSAVFEADVKLLY